jgi:isoamyl acetate esterase
MPQQFPSHASPASSSACAFREEICCFGDSITQQGHMAYGWVCALQEAYRRRADVLNRGYSGYSSRFGVAMLPHLFGPQRRYLVTTVFFGANDAADASSKPVQHVPLAEYAANMGEIVAAARRVSGGRRGGGGGEMGGTRGRVGLRG